MLPSHPSSHPSSPSSSVSPRPPAATPQTIFVCKSCTGVHFPSFLAAYTHRADDDTHEDANDETYQFFGPRGHQLAILADIATYQLQSDRKGALPTRIERVVLDVLERGDLSAEIGKLLVNAVGQSAKEGGNEPSSKRRRINMVDMVSQNPL